MKRGAVARAGLLLVGLLAAGHGLAPAARAEPVALAGHGYVVQMSGPQVASGLARHLLPPLTRAFERAGLVYRGGPDAEFVATVETSSDVGAWYGSGDARRWLYTREVLLDFAPRAVMDARPAHARRGIAVRLRTPDEDRTDEYACLVELAVADLLARGLPQARRNVDGTACARP